MLLEEGHVHLCLLTIGVDLSRLDACAYPDAEPLI